MQGEHDGDLRGRRCGSSRYTMVLTVSDREHEPAAVAVIAALYGVKDAISNLQQQQLVHAVQYADLLQAESVSQQALQLLHTAAHSQTGLTLKALATLAAVPSWPDCMLQLLLSVAKAVTADAATTAVAAGGTSAASGAAGACNTSASRNSIIQQILVATLGNLESVWQQQQLSRLLLQLPLPAMQLLLSSDKLQVYSEDTVLYTASKYLNSQNTMRQRLDVQEQLLPCIRVPQLSEFQLMVQASGPSQLHTSLILQVPSHRVLQLLQLKRLRPNFAELKECMQASMPDMPRSWFCGPRQICSVPDSGVQLVWKLPIVQLKALCQECMQPKPWVEVCNLQSPSTTPPLAGLEWKAQVQCVYDKDAKGVWMGFYAKTYLCPDNVFHQYDHSVKVVVGSQNIVSRESSNAPIKGSQGFGLEGPV